MTHSRTVTTDWTIEDGRRAVPIEQAGYLPKIPSQVSQVSQPMMPGRMGRMGRVNREAACGTKRMTARRILEWLVAGEDYEWAPDPTGTVQCNWCGNEWDDGHAPECPWTVARKHLVTTRAKP